MTTRKRQPAGGRLRTSRAWTSQPSLMPTQVTAALQSSARSRSQGSSPSTARPSAGRAASSSALASAMPCRLPNPPRWASPICVITPTFGRHKSASDGDFAAVARAQLEHRVVVVRLDGQHAQRHADVVVVVPRAGRAGQARFQHRVDHLPRGGLAHAAGHGDQRAGELPAFPGGPIDQGPDTCRRLAAPSGPGAD